ncbi:allergin-1 isoform X2 [Pleurodeles waltl]|uniref:allergin-1 isoform X2 n=1 Tax=Pleurodeles waltl TaxID=8319 RepID=UPI0037098254
MQTHPFLPHTAEWFFMRPQRRSEMFPALIIPLLLVKFQTTQEQASNDGAVSQPELWSKSTFAAAGQNVTLSCFTANGGLPITYELFKMDTIQKTVVVRERNGTAKFTVLVKNITDVGEYKCTAQNNFTTAKQYSKGLNLSLAEQVSKPKLYSNTSSAAVGHNVTLFCVADSGSLPINYSFFRGETFLSLLTRNDRLPATLTINLNSTSDLWMHKCKAENMLSDLQQYSASFNFTLEEPVSKPKLYSNTSSTAVGHNVTLFCVADSGSLPINYSFFRGETFLSLQTRNDRLPATLTINLNSPSCLWIHKCKAENMLSGLQQYSASFNFTLEVKDPSSMWLVICPVIVTVILLLIFILAFPLFILPRCKARKNNTSTVGNTASAKKSSALPASDESNYDAESTAQQGEVEYTTVFITNGNKVMERNDSEVQYSEILVRKSN